MSRAHLPRKVIPWTGRIVISDESRDLVPLYNSLLAKSQERQKRLRAEIEASKARQAEVST